MSASANNHGSATRRVLLGGLLASTLYSGASAQAVHDVFPNRPIRILLPYSAGGTSDFVIRLVAEKVSRSLGQPVIVENRPGAQEIASTQAVASARPDGYTIGMVGTSLALNPALGRERVNVPYAVDDFVPIIKYATYDYVMVVRKDLPVANLDEFLALARSQAGAVSFGRTSGTNHLAWLFLQRSAQVEMIDVPFRGNIDALNALIAGQIDGMVDTLGALAGQIDAGAVKAIAVTSPQRLPWLPDVGTVAERIPGYTMPSYNGLVAPRGTPAAAINTLNAAVNDALRSPDLRERLDAGRIGIVGGSPEDFASALRQDVEFFRRLIAENGL